MRGLLWDVPMVPTLGTLLGCAFNDLMGSSACLGSRADFSSPVVALDSG